MVPWRRPRASCLIIYSWGWGRRAARHTWWRLERPRGVLARRCLGKSTGTSTSMRRRCTTVDHLHISCSICCLAQLRVLVTWSLLCSPLSCVLRAASRLTPPRLRTRIIVHQGHAAPAESHHTLHSCHDPASTHPQITRGLAPILLSFLNVSVARAVAAAEETCAGQVRAEHVFALIMSNWCIIYSKMNTQRSGRTVSCIAIKGT